MPAGVTPVAGFELERYLGKWYEIARLDHSFERGLSRVTAEYSLREDGGVRVLNRGYSAEKGEWDEAEGKAYFVETPDLGYLKVSFFGAHTRREQRGPAAIHGARRRTRFRYQCPDPGRPGTIGVVSQRRAQYDPM